MKKILLAAALALVAFPAIAADVPTKAAGAPRLATFDSRGFYFGIGTEGATSNAEITTTAGETGAITTAGAGVGPVVGYFNGNARSFKAIEASVYWQNLGGSQLATQASARSNFSGNVDFMLGGTDAFTNLLALLPNLGLDGVFSNTAPVTGPNSMPFLSIGLNVQRSQFDILGVATNEDYTIRPSIGLGVFTRVIAPDGRDTGYATRTTAKYLPAGRGISIGSGTGLGDGNANMGRAFIVEFAVLRGSN